MVKLTLKIGVSLALMLYLIFTVDWNIIWATVLNTNMNFYVLSTIITLISPVFIALKYKQLIKGTSLSLSIPRLIFINYISRFYALFVPSAIGVEVVRWYKVTKNKQGRSFFLASTIVERIFFLLAIILFAALPHLQFSDNIEIISLRKKLFPLLSAMTIALLLLLSFFFFPIIRKKILYLVRLFLSKNNDSKINQFLKNFEIRQSVASIFFPLLFFSFIWQVFYILRIFFIFLSLHLPFGFIDIAWISSIVLILQILPISIAGLGVREGAYAYLFFLFGLPSEQGVSIGILFFLQMLIFATIGGVLELTE